MAALDDQKNQSRAVTVRFARTQMFVGGVVGPQTCYGGYPVKAQTIKPNLDFPITQGCAMLRVRTWKGHPQV